MVEYVGIKLTKYEEYECYKNWDSIESKEKVFSTNIPLALYLVSRYYPNLDQSIYDDVVQCAMIGLWKGVESYIPRKTKLPTYVSKCILNEVKMYFRRYYKHKDVCSLETLIGGNMTIKDTLYTKHDFTNMLEYEFIFDNIFNQLTGVDKDVMMDYFIEGKNQTTIAKKYNMSQSGISKKIARIKKQLLEQL